MPNLYVFGVGGTGARVIKSLTMVLASGIKAGKFDIVPILIDPHDTLQEFTSCKTMLKLYAEIHKELYNDVNDAVKDGFFRTSLRTLADVSPGTGLNDDFAISYNYSITFEQFLYRHDLSKQHRTNDFLSLLYSQQENFNKPLSWGFRGNPNVGSVVLNIIRQTPHFKAFETAFGAEDRIFIISSIFGGTGAAGFPLLLKIMRSHDKSEIRNAQIGALTVTPYFKLSDPQAATYDTAAGPKPQSSIDSRNFMGKSKSALSYYVSNINNLNAHYYIGDPYKQNKAYKNDEQTQEDAAHLVEFLGSLSLIHFCKNNFPGATREVFEYAIKDDNSPIHFKNIGHETATLTASSMTALHLFNQLHKKVRKDEHLPFRKSSKFDFPFFDQHFFSHQLEEFLEKYFQPWLKELEANERSFDPFDPVQKNGFMGIVKEFGKPKKIFPGLWDKPFDISDIYINMAKIEKKWGKLNANKKAKYLTMAHDGIHQSIGENISFKSKENGVQA